MAHGWFGRPLLLSNRTRSCGKGQLPKLVEAELRLGCDGFVFRLSAKPTDATFDKQMALLEEAFQSYAQAAFIYIEITADGVERTLLDIFKRYKFPRGSMIASRNPITLLELYRHAPDSYANASIIVDTEKGFANVGRCPYTTVEILDALATHDRILGVHRSMKEVFVRAAFDSSGRSNDEKEISGIQKRIEWLAHEKVDAIISDKTALLSRLLGLSKGNAA